MDYIKNVECPKVKNSKICFQGTTEISSNPPDDKDYQSFSPFKIDIFGKEMLVCVVPYFLTMLKVGACLLDTCSITSMVIHNFIRYSTLILNLSIKSQPLGGWYLKNFNLLPYKQLKFNHRCTHADGVLWWYIQFCSQGSNKYKHFNTSCPSHYLFFSPPLRLIKADRDWQKWMPCMSMTKHYVVIFFQCFNIWCMLYLQQRVCWNVMDKFMES